MREIKYRAFAKPVLQDGEVIYEGLMIKVDTIDFSKKLIGYYEPIIEFGGAIGRREYLKFNDIELMQYTGLHDKNGKEIYEGDIVRFTRVMNGGSIEEHTRTFQFSVKFADGCFVVDDWYLYEIECEVIGNIYEDLELIND